MSNKKRDTKWQTRNLECCSCGRESFPSLLERSNDCPDDGPWWSEDQPHHTCECGAVLRIEADGETAFTVDTENES